jgi:hypothetical protein
MMHAVSMQSMGKFIHDNFFMWESYWNWVSRVLRANVVVPIVGRDKTFTNLLQRLRIDSTRASLLSNLPQALTSGRAEDYDQALIATSYLNGFSRIHIEIDVDEHSPAATIGCLMHKAFTPYHAIDLRTANKIDNYLLNNMFRFMSSAQQSLIQWDLDLAQVGDRNYLRESFDSGFLKGAMGAAWRDFAYTPDVNPRGYGWSEGGHYTPVPTPPNPPEAEFINSGQRDVLCNPLNGKLSTYESDDLPQFDKLISIARLLEASGTVWNYRGNERPIGDAYTTVLSVLSQYRERMQQRSWKLSFLQRHFGLSSLVFPYNITNRERRMKDERTRFHNVTVGVMDAASMMLLADYSAVEHFDPNKMIQLMNLGFVAQTEMDMFCEIKDYADRTFTSADGFKKSERWKKTFDMLAEVKDGLGPFLSVVQESVIGDSAAEALNLDLIRLPTVDLPDYLSLIHKMDLAHAMVVGNENLFKFAPKFWLGGKDVSSTTPLYRRAYGPINPKTVKRLTRDDLARLRDNDQLTVYLRDGLENKESIKFDMPVQIEDVITNGLILQDRRKLNVSQMGFVDVAGRIECYITFKEDEPFEDNLSNLYGEVPRWVTMSRTFFEKSEVEFYGECVQMYQFLKKSFHVIGSDSSFYGFSMTV